MSDNWQKSVEETVAGVNDAAAAAGSTLEQGAQSVADSLGSAAQTAGEAVQSGAQKASQGMQDAAENLGEAAQDAADSVSEGAERAADGSRNAIDDLVDEVGKAGDKVVDSAKTIWESDQRKDVQDAVVKALTSIAEAIEAQFRKLADMEETKTLVTRIEQTTDKAVESVRASKTAQDAAEGILKGLQGAAAGIERWLNQQKSQFPPKTDSEDLPADGQDIPIEPKDL